MKCASNGYRTNYTKGEIGKPVEYVYVLRVFIER